MQNKGGTKSQKPFTKFRPLFITFTLLIFLILVLRTDHKKPKSTNFYEPTVQFNPTVEFTNGTDVIWQIPDSPKSVIFLAHGCNGRAANFWDKSPKCAHCIGLPEERLITLEALRRKFAVVTVSSAGRCWSLGKEKAVVEGIIRTWVTKHDLKTLPLVALGASSGGYFVSVLATRMKFSSITIMIAEGVFDRIDVTPDYPPTLFVHMPKDVVRKVTIGVNLEVLKGQGVDVGEIQCLEFPLSPSFLTDRIPGLELSESLALCDLFREKGFVDERGYMRNDGRSLPWKAALKEAGIRVPEGLVGHIQEELNLAYAYHEMTSLQSPEIFEWFESHFRS